MQSACQCCPGTCSMPYTLCTSPLCQISTPHPPCSNREEKVRQQKRAPGEATPPRSATVSGGGEAGGAAEATRALGFMEVKSQAGKPQGSRPGSHFTVLCGRHLHCSQLCIAS